MILDVSVTEYRQTFTAWQIGLTRDKSTESMLRDVYVPAWFANPVNSHLTFDFTGSPGLQWYVDRYSEAVTSEPWRDIEYYFHQRNLGRVFRGRLFYPRSAPILNVSAMASASEAIAGWFCRSQYGWDLYFRPARVTPDIILRDNQTGRLALVEVKSSSNMGNPKRKMTTDMINLINKALLHTQRLRPALYNVALIMVQVASPTEVSLTSLVLEEA